MKAQVLKLARAVGVLVGRSSGKDVNARSCIRVYKISHMRESVRRISENLQGRVWSGKHFNSYSRLGPGPAFDLTVKYYSVS